MQENKQILYLIGTPYPKTGPVLSITPYLGRTATTGTLKQAVDFLNKTRKHTKRKGYKLYIIEEYEEVENTEED